MSKRNFGMTASKIAKRIKEGRGQGIGSSYKPWLYIQDVPSLGRSHRVKGHKTTRVHHLLSDLELRYFVILDLATGVIDIREQYPLLNLDETKMIAESLGVKHPQDPDSGDFIVMTTDFLITRRENGQEILSARTIKYAQDLESERVIEKLEIERVYWKHKGVGWSVITERDIHPVASKTCAFLHKYYDGVTGITELSAEGLLEVRERLEDLLKGKVPLREAASIVNKQIGLPTGVSLTCAYYFMATGVWKIDITQDLNPRMPVSIQTVL